MGRQESGFTLIELIMVIVILGILAAVALPKYSDLSANAQTAALSGAEGALNSTAVVLIATNNGALPTAAEIITGTVFSAGLSAASATADTATTCVITVSLDSNGDGTADASNDVTIDTGICNPA